MTDPEGVTDTWLPESNQQNTAVTRTNRGFTDEVATRHMHDQFARRALPQRWTTTDASGGAAAQVRRIVAARNAGDLVYRRSS